MGLVEVIPKTKYTLRGAAASTQQFILKDRIPVIGFSSVLIVVRIYERNGFSGGLSVFPRVYSVSECPDEQGTSFVATAELVGLAAITAGVPSNLPALVVEALAPPIGPMLRVVLEAVQGPDPPGSTTELTLGVDLVAREG